MRRFARADFAVHPAAPLRCLLEVPTELLQALLQRGLLGPHRLHVRHSVAPGLTRLPRRVTALTLARTLLPARAARLLAALPRSRLLTLLTLQALLTLLALLALLTLLLRRVRRLRTRGTTRLGPGRRCGRRGRLSGATLRRVPRLA
jgi:hypothetical protein